MRARGTTTGVDRKDAGQATIAMAGLVVLVAVVALGLSVVAEAVIHRARARTAADAVALAAVVDPVAAQRVQAHYERQGVQFDAVGPATIARSGPSQAHSFAELGPSAGQPAPVLVAIIARAEQLTGAPFEQIRWRSTSVAIATGDAPRLQAVAGGLGLCGSDGGGPVGWVDFERC